jgi:alpha-tubulin suppressor-like RCC1 family protein
LGDGTTVNHTYAAAVPTLASGVFGHFCGKYHTCALKTDGSVWCWGSNMYGQVGVQQIGNQLIPGP